MNIRLPLFLLIALAQISVPAYLIHREETTLTQGHLLKFKTAPVDPVDALRGRYVSLSFDAATVPHNLDGSLGDAAQKHPIPVYATFAEDTTTGYATLTALSDQKPSSNNTATLQVLFHPRYRDPRQIELPFNRFYMEEHAAPNAEAAYRQNTSKKQDTYALVAIYHGHAAIKDLYIGGVPIRDYLQSHPEGK